MVGCRRHGGGVVRGIGDESYLAIRQRLLVICERLHCFDTNFVIAN